MPAKFYEQDVRARLSQKRKLSVFLDQIVRKYNKETTRIRLTYIFCSDDHLLNMNQQFLQHDTLTDIITFDLSETKKDMYGEIYISIDRVADNAAKFNTTYNDELHRVIFHGALHLCGFKDKTTADKVQMRKMEDQCLQAYQKEI